MRITNGNYKKAIKTNGCHKKNEKKDGSSLFRIYVPFQEIPEIESLFQPMESLKANSKYDFMGSRLYTFKRIDSYCGTNFAEVYLGTIDKNQ